MFQTSKLRECKTQKMILSTHFLWISPRIKSNVKHLCKMLSKTIYLLRQLKCITSHATLQSVYFALFRSNMSCGIIFWGNSFSSNISHSRMPFKRYGIIMLIPISYSFSILLEIHKHSETTRTQNYITTTTLAGTMLFIRNSRYRLET